MTCFVMPLPFTVYSYNLCFLLKASWGHVVVYIFCLWSNVNSLLATIAHYIYFLHSLPNKVTFHTFIWDDFYLFYIFCYKVFRNSFRLFPWNERENEVLSIVNQNLNLTTFKKYSIFKSDRQFFLFIKS